MKAVNELNAHTNAGTSIIMTRSRLVKTLGPNYDRYATLMKRWFTKEITKEEYDHELRTFLNSNQIKFHNKFILSVLSKCSNKVVPSSILTELDLQPEVKRIKLEEIDTASFKPLPRIDPHQYLEPVTSKSLQEELVAKGFLHFLPDEEAVYARVMLHAWEHDLEGVDDGACKLIIEATFAFARNLLAATISRRAGFRTMDDNFMYNAGVPAVNPWLRNTLRHNPQNVCQPTEIVDDNEFIHIPKSKPTVHELEENIATELSLSSVNTKSIRKSPICVDDIIDVLKVHSHLIPRYFMYSINMEKFMLARHHPSWDDLNSVTRSRGDMFHKRQHHFDAFSNYQNNPKNLSF